MPLVELLPASTVAVALQSTRKLQRSTLDLPRFTIDRLLQVFKDTISSRIALSRICSGAVETAKKRCSQNYLQRSVCYLPSVAISGLLKSVKNEPWKDAAVFEDPWRGVMLRRTASARRVEFKSSREGVGRVGAGL